MADLFVKPGNRVEHDGEVFAEGEKAGIKLPALSKEQSQALLNAGVVQTTDPGNGVSPIDTHVPTDEEVAAAAAEAETKRGGLLNFGK